MSQPPCNCSRDNLCPRPTADAMQWCDYCDSLRPLEEFRLHAQTGLPGHQCKRCTKERKNASARTKRAIMSRRVQPTADNPTVVISQTSSSQTVRAAAALRALADLIEGA